MIAVIVSVARVRVAGRLFWAGAFGVEVT